MQNPEKAELVEKLMEMEQPLLEAQKKAQEESQKTAKNESLSSGSETSSDTESDNVLEIPSDNMLKIREIIQERFSDDNEDVLAGKVEELNVINEQLLKDDKENNKDKTEYLDKKLPDRQVSNDRLLEWGNHYCLKTEAANQLRQVVKGTAMEDTETIMSIYGDILRNRILVHVDNKINAKDLVAEIKYKMCQGQNSIFKQCLCQPTTTTKQLDIPVFTTDGNLQGMWKIHRANSKSLPNQHLPEYNPIQGPLLEMVKNDDFRTCYPALSPIKKPDKIKSPSIQLLDGTHYTTGTLDLYPIEDDNSKAVTDKGNSTTNKYKRKTIVNKKEESSDSDETGFNYEFRTPNKNHIVDRYGELMETPIGKKLTCKEYLPYETIPASRLQGKCGEGAKAYIDNNASIIEFGRETNRSTEAQGKDAIQDKLETHLNDNDNSNAPSSNEETESEYDIYSDTDDDCDMCYQFSLFGVAAIKRIQTTRSQNLSLEKMLPQTHIPEFDALYDEKRIADSFTCIDDLKEVYTAMLQQVQTWYSPNELIMRDTTIMEKLFNNKGIAKNNSDLEALDSESSEVRKAVRDIYEIVHDIKPVVEFVEQASKEIRLRRKTLDVKDGEKELRKCLAEICYQVDVINKINVYHKIVHGSESDNIIYGRTASLGVKANKTYAGESVGTSYDVNLRSSLSGNETLKDYNESVNVLGRALGNAVTGTNNGNQRCSNASSSKDSTDGNKPRQGVILDPQGVNLTRPPPAHADHNVKQLTPTPRKICPHFVPCRPTRITMLKKGSSIVDNAQHNPVIEFATSSVYNFKSRGRSRVRSTRVRKENAHVNNEEANSQASSDLENVADNAQSGPNKTVEKSSDLGNTTHSNSAKILNEPGTIYSEIRPMENYCILAKLILDNIKKWSLETGRKTTTNSEETPLTPSIDDLIHRARFMEQRHIHSRYKLPTNHLDTNIYQVNGRTLENIADELALAVSSCFKDNCFSIGKFVDTIFINLKALDSEALGGLVHDSSTHPNAKTIKEMENCLTKTAISYMQQYVLKFGSNGKLEEQYVVNAQKLVFQCLLVKSTELFEGYHDNATDSTQATCKVKITLMQDVLDSICVINKAIDWARGRAAAQYQIRIYSDVSSDSETSSDAKPEPPNKTKKWERLRIAREDLKKTVYDKVSLAKISKTGKRIRKDPRFNFTTYARVCSDNLAKGSKKCCRKPQLVTCTNKRCNKVNQPFTDNVQVCLTCNPLINASFICQFCQTVGNLVAKQPDNNCNTPVKTSTNNSTSSKNNTLKGINTSNNSQDNDANKSDDNEEKGKKESAWSKRTTDNTPKFKLRRRYQIDSSLYDDSSDDEPISHVTRSKVYEKHQYFLKASVEAYQTCDLANRFSSSKKMLEVGDVIRGHEMATMCKIPYAYRDAMGFFTQNYTGKDKPDNLNRFIALPHQTQEMLSQEFVQKSDLHYARMIDRKHHEQTQRRFLYANSLLSGLSTQTAPKSVLWNGKTTDCHLTNVNNFDVENTVNRYSSANLCLNAATVIEEYVKQAQLDATTFTYDHCYLDYQLEKQEEYIDQVIATQCSSSDVVHQSAIVFQNTVFDYLKFAKCFQKHCKRQIDCYREMPFRSFEIYQFSRDDGKIAQIMLNKYEAIATPILAMIRYRTNVQYGISEAAILSMMEYKAQMSNYDAMRMRILAEKNNKTVLEDVVFENCMLQPEYTQGQVKYCYRIWKHGNWYASAQQNTRVLGIFDTDSRYANDFLQTCTKAKKEEEDSAKNDSKRVQLNKGPNWYWLKNCVKGAVKPTPKAPPKGARQRTYSSIVVASPRENNSDNGDDSDNNKNNRQRVQKELNAKITTLDVKDNWKNYHDNKKKEKLQQYRDNFSRRNSAPCGRKQSGNLNYWDYAYPKAKLEKWVKKSSVVKSENKNDDKEKLLPIIKAEVKKQDKNVSEWDGDWYEEEWAATGSKKDQYGLCYKETEWEQDWNDNDWNQEWGSEDWNTSKYDGNHKIDTSTNNEKIPNEKKEKPVTVKTLKPVSAQVKIPKAPIEFTVENIANKQTNLKLAKLTTANKIILKDEDLQDWKHTEDPLKVLNDSNPEVTANLKNWTNVEATNEDNQEVMIYEPCYDNSLNSGEDMLVTTGNNVYVAQDTASAVHLHNATKCAGVNCFSGGAMDYNRNSPKFRELVRNVAKQQRRTPIEEENEPPYLMVPRPTSQPYTLAAPPIAKGCRAAKGRVAPGQIHLEALGGQYIEHRGKGMIEANPDLYIHEAKGVKGAKGGKYPGKGNIGHRAGILAINEKGEVDLRGKGDGVQGILQGRFNNDGTFIGIASRLHANLHDYPRYPSIDATQRDIELQQIPDREINHDIDYPIVEIYHRELVSLENLKANGAIKDDKFADFHGIYEYNRGRFTRQIIFDKCHFYIQWKSLKHSCKKLYGNVNDNTYLPSDKRRVDLNASATGTTANRIWAVPAYARKLIGDNWGLFFGNNISAFKFVKMIDEEGKESSYLESQKIICDTMIPLVKHTNKVNLDVDILPRYMDMVKERRTDLIKRANYFRMNKYHIEQYEEDFFDFLVDNGIEPEVDPLNQAQANHATRMFESSWQEFVPQITEQMITTADSMSQHLMVTRFYGSGGGPKPFGFYVKTYGAEGQSAHFHPLRLFNMEESFITVMKGIIKDGYLPNCKKHLMSYMLNGSNVREDLNHLNGKTPQQIEMKLNEMLTSNHYRLMVTANMLDPVTNNHSPSYVSETLGLIIINPENLRPELDNTPGWSVPKKGLVEERANIQVYIARCPYYLYLKLRGLRTNASEHKPAQQTIYNPRCASSAPVFVSSNCYPSGRNYHQLCAGLGIFNENNMPFVKFWSENFHNQYILYMNVYANALRAGLVWGLFRSEKFGFTDECSVKTDDDGNIISKKPGWKCDSSGRRHLFSEVNWYKAPNAFKKVLNEANISSKFRAIPAKNIMHYAMEARKCGGFHQIAMARSTPYLCPITGVVSVVKFQEDNSPYDEYADRTEYAYDSESFPRRYNIAKVVKHQFRNDTPWTTEEVKTANFWVNHSARCYSRLKAFGTPIHVNAQIVNPESPGLVVKKEKADELFRRAAPWLDNKKLKKKGKVTPEKDHDMTPRKIFKEAKHEKANDNSDDMYSESESVITDDDIPDVVEEEEDDNTNNAYITELNESDLNDATVKQPGQQLISYVNEGFAIKENDRSVYFNETANMASDFLTGERERFDFPETDSDGVVHDMTYLTVNNRIPKTVTKNGKIDTFEPISYDRITLNKNSLYAKENDKFKAEHGMTEDDTVDEVIKTLEVDDAWAVAEPQAIITLGNYLDNDGKQLIKTRTTLPPHQFRGVGMSTLRLVPRGSRYGQNGITQGPAIEEGVDHHKLDIMGMTRRAQGNLQSAYHKEGHSFETYCQKLLTTTKEKDIEDTEATFKQAMSLLPMNKIIPRNYYNIKSFVNPNFTTKIPPMYEPIKPELETIFANACDYNDGRVMALNLMIKRLINIHPRLTAEETTLAKGEMLKITAQAFARALSDFTYAVAAYSTRTTDPHISETKLSADTSKSFPPMLKWHKTKKNWENQDLQTLNYLWRKEDVSSDDVESVEASAQNLEDCFTNAIFNDLPVTPCLRQSEEQLEEAIEESVRRYNAESGEVDYHENLHLLSERYRNSTLSKAVEGLPDGEDVYGELDLQVKRQVMEKRARQNNRLLG